mmetsp:Transcript_15860/g.44565  ORF Transcript_15860/g.44565 Transcript_15860/m.44565 type:complete len:224 (-) Transcript_15860:995-1666(-)
MSYSWPSSISGCSRPPPHTFSYTSSLHSESLPHSSSTGSKRSWPASSRSTQLASSSFPSTRSRSGCTLRMPMASARRSDLWHPRWAASGSRPTVMSSISTRSPASPHRTVRLRTARRACATWSHTRSPLSSLPSAPSPAASAPPTRTTSSDSSRKLLSLNGSPQSPMALRSRCPPICWRPMSSSSTIPDPFTVARARSARTRSAWSAGTSPSRRLSILRAVPS